MNQVNLTESAFKRIQEIKRNPDNQNKFLRIAISGGGCSGFQYLFSLDDKIMDDDIKIAEQNSDIIALTDPISLDFLKGAEIDFVKELGASYFKVNNPNAKASCGCGSSFNV